MRIMGLVAVTTAAVLLSPSAHATTTTTTSWSGGSWEVKSGTSPMGPGPNVFAATGPYVDSSGAMHLRIQKSRGRWTCSEVMLVGSLGYGTYEWTVRSDVHALDPNVVLGLFTWDDADVSPTHREIDVEVAKWGSRTEPTNAQYVVQPAANVGNLNRFTLPADPVRVRFTWLAGSVAFSGEDAKTGAPLASSAYTGPDVPTPGTERVHMNLWLYRGKAPVNGAAVDVALSSFSFSKAP